MSESLTVIKEYDMLAALEAYYVFGHLPRKVREYLEAHYESAALHALVHGEKITSELPVIAVSSWAQHFDIHVETFVEFLLSDLIMGRSNAFSEFCRASVYIWSAASNRSRDVPATIKASIPADVDVLPILAAYGGEGSSPEDTLGKLRAKAVSFAFPEEEEAEKILRGEHDRELVAEWIGMELVTTRGLGEPVVFDLDKLRTFKELTSPLDGTTYVLHLKSPDFLQYYLSQIEEKEKANNED